MDPTSFWYSWGPIIDHCSETIFFNSSFEETFFYRPLVSKWPRNIQRWFKSADWGGIFSCYGTFQINHKLFISVEIIFLRFVSHSSKFYCIQSCSSCHQYTPYFQLYLLTFTPKHNRTTSMFHWGAYISYTVVFVGLPPDSMDAFGTKEVNF